MNADLAALLYLVSGVLFILALRGLSSPETSRQGNRFGMIGMAIAIVTTLWLIGPDTMTWIIIVAAIAVGGRPRHHLRDRRAFPGDEKMVLLLEALQAAGQAERPGLRGRRGDEPCEGDEQLLPAPPVDREADREQDTDRPGEHREEDDAPEKRAVGHPVEDDTGERGGHDRDPDGEHDLGGRNHPSMVRPPARA